MEWFQRIGLREKVLLTVAVTCLICASASLGVGVYFKNREFREGLVSKAQTIHSRIHVASQYVAKQGGLANMVDFYKKKYRSSDELTDEDKKIIIQQVPIYAAMRIGAMDSEKEMYSFRVFSNEPRNKDNQATPDEMKIFDRFATKPELEEIVHDVGRYVTVYRPVRIKEKSGCLTCHGDPLTSPWGNGKDILGQNMENWQDGKLHGVFAITSDVKMIDAENHESGKISATTYMGGFITVGAFFALGLAYFIVRSPLETLKNVTINLENSKALLMHASEQIGEASTDLASTSKQQSISLHDTATSVKEMSSMIESNSMNAQEAANASIRSKAKADCGKEVVKKMIDSMKVIDQSNQDFVEQINQSNNELKSIIEVISEIESKTKVINEIVFQTKLLSFNASVEASRAGEHGKGFAVVAEEIGNLAQMSGKASLEISTMLEESMGKVDRIIKKTKANVDSIVLSGNEKIENGVMTAKECGDVLEEIFRNVSNVTKIASAIETAGAEQAEGISEINKALDELHQVTQKNSHTGLETASAAEKLASESRALNIIVSELSLTIYGDKKKS